MQQKPLPSSKKPIPTNSLQTFQTDKKITSIPSRKKKNFSKHTLLLQVFTHFFPDRFNYLLYCSIRISLYCTAERFSPKSPPLAKQIINSNVNAVQRKKASTMYIDILIIFTHCAVENIFLALCCFKCKFYHIPNQKKINVDGVQGNGILVCLFY